jgi:hypothetical protein
MGMFSGELQLTAASAAADMPKKRRGLLNLEKISCRIQRPRNIFSFNGGWETN